MADNRQVTFRNVGALAPADAAVAKVVASALRPPSKAAHRFADVTDRIIVAVCAATAAMIVAVGWSSAELPGWLMYVPVAAVVVWAATAAAITGFGYVRQRRSLRCLCQMRGPQMTVASLLTWLAVFPSQGRQRVYVTSAVEHLGVGKLGYADMMATTFALMYRQMAGVRDPRGWEAAYALGLASTAANPVSSQQLAIVVTMSAHPHVGTLHRASSGYSASFESIAKCVTMAGRQPLAVTEIAATLASDSPGLHTVEQWLEIAELVVAPVTS